MTPELEAAEKRLWLWISRYQDDAFGESNPAVFDKVQIAIDMFRDAARSEALEEAAKIAERSDITTDSTGDIRLGDVDYIASAIRALKDGA